MAAMPYIFQNIIVKLLTLTEGVLDIFVNPPTYVAGNLGNCGGATVTAGTITDCGNALIQQIGALAVSGIGLLQGTLNALMAAPHA